MYKRQDLDIKVPSKSISPKSTTSGNKNPDTKNIASKLGNKPRTTSPVSSECIISGPTLNTVININRAPNILNVSHSGCLLYTSKHYN